MRINRRAAPTQQPGVVAIERTTHGSCTVLRCLTFADNYMSTMPAVLHRLMLQQGGCAHMQAATEDMSIGAAPDLGPVVGALDAGVNSIPFLGELHTTRPQLGVLALQRMHQHPLNWQYPPRRSCRDGGSCKSTGPAHLGPEAEVHKEAKAPSRDPRPLPRLPPSPDFLHSR